MTLLDYFAAQASHPPDWWLKLVTNTTSIPPCGGQEYVEAIAEWKYMQARAMLKARKES